MCGRIGVQEIMIIVLVFGVLFGVNRLPQMGRNLGLGMRNFKRGIEGTPPKPRRARRRRRRDNDDQT